jgi:2-polyprenyl-6-methoxyphenol hydroxylase-like FAD-dependent oxidoreductase
MKTLSCDVAVIGAGSVGCVAALAFARSGAKVMLLEAQPQNAKRLAGEWLHPPGLKVLERLGILLTPDAVNYATGLGFVVFADDSTEPIQLRYPNDTVGFSYEHNLILSTLRKAAGDCKGIDFISHARVTQIQGQQLTFQHLKQRETFTVFTNRIVGADGRFSIARKALGILHQPKLLSYMAGVLLENVDLPFEGFGHVLLGGPGPTLVYRINHNQVRICLDVPLDFQKRPAHLWDAYSPILPSGLLRAFRKALEQDRVVWVANHYSSRIHYGRPGLALVGDATGYFHPLTATGMTLGFLDAECLVRSRSFEEYQRQRRLGTYVPEMLATTLHEVFYRNDDSAVAIRKAIYQMWRRDSKERVRTMHLLSGAQVNILHFSRSFLKGLAIAVGFVIGENASKNQWWQLIKVLTAFGRWLRLPIVIALSHLRKPKSGEKHGVAKYQSWAITKAKIGKLFSI